MHNKMTKNGKSAFTLAEVLITLVVIGIIAAITIPILNQKYTKHSLYSAFMKNYNTITNMLEMSKANNGAIDSWAIDESDQDAAKEKYIYPYLSYSKKCDSSDPCPSYTITALSGDMTVTTSDLNMDNTAIILQDGSTFNVRFDEDELTFYFDTNASQGPNVLGRDFFVLVYKNQNGKWGFQMDDGDNGPANCNVSTSGAGQGCPARLLGEGKMNY